MAEKYHPMVELLVACEMAGKTLLKVSGSLQERHNEDQDAGDLNLESIDQAANDVLKAMARYTSSLVRS